MALVTVLVLVTGLFSTNARAAVDLASNVALQVVARPASAAGASEDFELRDGGVLRSGDGVQLRLESDADAYVYVIAYGSSHTAILLHPFSGRAEDARMRAGQVQVIPGSGVFLPLDEREGREALFTIVSAAPLSEISRLLPRIETYGGDLSRITAMIGSDYPGVKRLTFKHIAARPLVGVTAIAARAAAAPAPAEPAAEDAGSTRIGGAGLQPSAESGWGVSPTKGFGASDEATAPALSTAAAASASTATSAKTDTVAASPQAGASPAPTDAAPVSEALREARQAAGIGESEFRGILATLPGSGEAGVPTSIAKPYKEQGVLSAEGSRIRSLGRSRVGSDTQGSAQN